MMPLIVTSVCLYHSLYLSNWSSYLFTMEVAICCITSAKSLEIFQSSFKATVYVSFQLWVQFSVICHFLSNKSRVGDNYALPILVLTVHSFIFFAKYAYLLSVGRVTLKDEQPRSPKLFHLHLFPLVQYVLNKTRDNMFIFQTLRCCCEVDFQPGLLFSPVPSLNAELSFSAGGCGLILNGTVMNVVSIFSSNAPKMSNYYLKKRK